MNPVVLILAVAILLTVGFLLGVVLRSSKPNDLDRKERKELMSYRLLINELTASAGEHAALGDNFAVIALSRINEQQRRNLG